MIDPHAHLRDWKQESKETVKHGLSVAYRAGLDAVFEMPNTDPALTSKKVITERIALADRAMKDLKEEAGANTFSIFHGIFAGITDDANQIGDVVSLWKESDRVIGLKMFAGHSTGNMGITDESQQRNVFRTLVKLGYDGVLAIHCEKESVMKAGLWNPADPITHTLARPPEAEVESLKDMIRFASEEGFGGTVHICHVSVPESVGLIDEQRRRGKIKMTCGLTPHHGMLNAEMMNGTDGILLKMNPPLRPKMMADRMAELIIEGKIDWIETDHAPHTLDDKRKSSASGIPGFPAHPLFVEMLKKKGMPQKKIDEITHSNIVKAFGAKAKGIKNTRRKALAKESLAKEYPFDAFAL
jgi:dihydroorotase